MHRTFEQPHLWKTLPDHSAVRLHRYGFVWFRVRRFETSQVISRGKRNERPAQGQLGGMVKVNFKVVEVFSAYFSKNGRI